MLKVYVYGQCDTCRRALKWLKEQGLEYVAHPIRETPPTAVELRTMLSAHGGEMRRLFNVGGRDYRALKLGEKLPGMNEAQALALLAGNGNLVKRPFLLGPGVNLLGFDETIWSSALASR